MCRDLGMKIWGVFEKNKLLKLSFLEVILLMMRLNICEEPSQFMRECLEENILFGFQTDGEIKE